MLLNYACTGSVHMFVSWPPVVLHVREAHAVNCRRNMESVVCKFYHLHLDCFFEKIFDKKQ